MPRDGSSIYHKPFPDVIHNTTIESVVYNGFVNDIEGDLNNARPILSGGTGANNARDAMLNLKGEIALQSVTNFDSHPWVSGSFFAVAGATAAPNAVDAFVGEYYQNLTGDHATVHARANTGTPYGPLYVRQKVAGVWGAWFDTDKVMDDKKVNRAGDVMVGDLAIDKANPALILDKAVTGQASYILGQTNAIARWRVDLGDTLAESSTQTGSDFTIRRYTNAGALIDTPFKIERATGNVTMPGSITVGGTINTTGTATFSGPLTATNITATSNLTVNGTATIAGASTFTNDITVYRSGSPTTGYIFYGNSGSKYLGFNGTYFQFSGGDVYGSAAINAATSLSAGTSLSVGTTAAIGASLSVGTTASFGGQTTHNGGAFIQSSLPGVNAAGPGPFEVRGGYPALSFHWPTVFLSNITMNVDGNFYMGGGSHGANYYKFWTTRDFTGLPSAVSANRLVHVADLFHSLASGMAENWPGSVVTGATGLFSNGITLRYRYLQYLIDGGWYTAGTA